MSQRFHERFEIPQRMEDARKRFINRVQNQIFDYLEASLSETDLAMIYSRLANALGDRRTSLDSLSGFAGYDFYRTLQTIEECYAWLLDGIGDLHEVVDLAVKNLLKESELDLGIVWEQGRFTRKGAELLDDKLVNEPLRWLSNPKYLTAYEPFKKAMMHFVEATARPELLNDVVTDMYESLEALAKIVTGKSEKDLSANAELFLAKVNASDNYKKLLKDYIEYANLFRHASRQGKERPKLSESEVESFVYLTGIFIRLAIAK